MIQPLQLNVPIQKIDEEERIVYGYATVEEVDAHDQIVSYEGSKEAFSSWVGNIREMHDNTRAIGKKVTVEFDDDHKGVWLGAYISESVDGQNAWQKIKEGVLTGFSIGGKVLKFGTKKIGDKTHTVIERYKLGEVSVVDSPAAPSAVLQIVKSSAGGLVSTEKMRVNTGLDRPWFEKAYKFADNQELIKLGGPSYNKNMDINKSIWQASNLIYLAQLLSDYVWFKDYEGEEVDQLKAAVEAIKDAAVNELTDSEKWPSDLEEAVELAMKTLDLSKSKLGAYAMSKKTQDEEVEKSVVGQEDRNSKGEVTATAEDNTPEVTPATEQSQQTAIDAADDATAEVTEETEEAEEKPKASKKSADEEADINKSDDQGDLAKSILGGVEQLIEKAVAPLNERIAEIEKKAAPSKAKASFTDVKKSEESEAGEVNADLKKQFDEANARAEQLSADPTLGTIQERTALAIKMRSLAYKMDPATQVKHSAIRATFQE